MRGTDGGIIVVASVIFLIDINRIILYSENKIKTNFIMNEFYEQNCLTEIYQSNDHVFMNVLATADLCTTLSMNFQHSMLSLIIKYTKLFWYENY